MTEIEINGTKVDFINFSGVILSKRFENYTKPNQRSGAYSNTIKIIGNDVSHELFGFLFNVNLSTRTFNPKLKASASIYESGLPVLNGVAIMKQITLEDGVWYYHVQIGDEYVDFFKEMGESLLSEVGWNDLNHTYNATNVVAGWSPTLGEDYCYPMINYQKSTFVDWFTEDFKMCIFVKEYVDRMFSNLGFTYDSDFFDSDFFKGLIVAYSNGNEEVSSTIIAERSYSVTSNADQQKSYNEPIDFANIISNTVDNGWDGDSFYVGIGGLYELDFDLDVDIEYVGSGGNSNSSSQIQAYMSIVSTTRGELWRGDREVFNFTTAVSNGTRTTSQNLVFSASLQLIQGESIYLTYVTQADIQTQQAYNEVAPPMDINIGNGGAHTCTYATKTFVEGDTIIAAGMIPKVRQIDFFMELVKMFNLVVKPLGNKQLKIEPLDDFYSDDVVDLTKLVDRSKTITQSPNGVLAHSRYRYSYKEDPANYYNDLYRKDTGEEYGERVVDYAYDLNNEEKSLGLKSSITLLEDDDIASNLLFPTMVGENSQPVKNNWRILQWFGLSSGNFNFKHSSPLVTDPKTQYPFAGDIDNPTNPQFSLSFQTPIKVYYPTTSYPADNLFSEYHENSFKRVLDGFTVKGTFILSYLDWLNFDFDKKFKIDEQFYRALEIKGYSLKYGVCEITLIKD